jgi:TatD DNase family protein
MADYPHGASGSPSTLVILIISRLQVIIYFCSMVNYTLIDTHTHIYLQEFEEDLTNVFQRANAEGVSHFLLPAIDSETFDSVLALESSFPNSCTAMAGLHPCSVKENYQEELRFVQQQLTSRPYKAIGEIGLDFYWDRTFAQQQYEVFEQQMQWALHYKLPISIHSRNAMGETIEKVKPFAQKGLRGVFHCFSGSYESAKEIINLDFKLGIGGVVTYKNTGLQQVLSKIDLKHIVLETDAPYLSPVPYRGKRNEPSYLRHIADQIAIIKNCNIEVVAQATSQNAIEVFGL